MIEEIKNISIVKRVRKTLWYSRLRQYFPMSDVEYVDDRDHLDDAEIIKMFWPSHINKPTIGIIQDYDDFPKWTKYIRFLESNSFKYGLYSIHQDDWIDKAKKFDIIIGLPSNAFYHLYEIRSKFEILESYLGKTCYPSSTHVRLYEDKCYEAYISKVTNIPFAKTHVFFEKEDALRMITSLKFPVVSKIIPSSGSQGVQLVNSVNQAKKIVEEAFSIKGRNTHLISYRQKNLVYLQDYIPNDGYDIRVIVIGNWVFGSYRQVPPGDFRASGMKLEVRRELPVDAMKTALNVSKIINSPVIAVDMVHGLDDKYYVIEFSPSFQMDTTAEFRLNGVPGVIIFDDNGNYKFKEGRFWLAELALREFLQHYYLHQVEKKPQR